MRYSTSCRECRVGKRKCTPDPAGRQLCCLVCKSRRIKCSNTAIPPSRLVAPSDRPAGSPQHLAIPATPDEQSASAPSGQEFEFINLYFRYIHDRPHSLFHEDSIWEALRNKSLPEHLWTAMCVMGCRFAPHQSQRDLAPVFVGRSRALLGQQLDQMSLENVQTCVLLGNWYSTVQDAEQEIMYFGMANRIALLLRLQEPNPNDSFIMQEIKLRTWWSLVIADNWCPSSLGLPRALRADSTGNLPMDEPEFQQMSSTDKVESVHRRKGLWAYHASLASIFALIQDINFILVANDISRSMTDHVDMVAQRLLEWHDSLPSTMLMNSANLDTYRKKGHGGSFIALYFGYHYYSIILYFQFLNPSHQEIDKAATYANRAKHHALTFSRLLHTARSHGDCHVVYLVVAHLTVVSSSVLLHSLLFGDAAEVEEARTYLTLNFEALEELTTYWPCVERMKDRLFVFQNRCLREPAADAYVLDRWTVRFLLEHALPFKETFVHGKEDWADHGPFSATSRSKG